METNARVGAQDLDHASFVVATDVNGLAVDVVVVDSMELGLLGIFVDQTEPLTVRAEASASPRLLP